MTRPQWLLVAFIGVLAAVAYTRSDAIARSLGMAGWLFQQSNSQVAI